MVVWLDFAGYGLTGWDCLVIVIWLMVLVGLVRSGCGLVRLLF